MKYIYAIPLLILSACGPNEYPKSCTYHKTDEIKDIFISCLKNSQNSQTVKYNDSAEVVEECKFAANTMARSYTGGIQYQGFGPCIEPVGATK